MNKFIIALFLTLFVLSSATKVGDIVQPTQCAEKTIEVLRSDLEAKVKELQAVTILFNPGSRKRTTQG